MKPVLLLCFLFSGWLQAQDITGRWKGELETNGTIIPFEMVIGERGATTTGYYMMVFTVKGVENTGIKSLIFSEADSSFEIEDGDMVFNNYSTPGRRVKFYASMRIPFSDTATLLEGRFRTRPMDFRARDNNRFTGTIRLIKVGINDSSALVSRLKDLNLFRDLAFHQANKPAVSRDSVTEATVSSPDPHPRDIRVSTVAINQPNASNPSGNKLIKPDKSTEIIFSKKAALELAYRKKDIVRTVSFHSDSLVLSLFDNGIVDGDTVSVVLNDQVIIPNLGLVAKAKKFVLPVTAEMGDSLVLVMYAENLGTIPPNTGVLYIQDGETRYDIRFSGDMKTSAAIILRREKKK